MSRLIVSDFLDERLKLKFEDFTIDEIDFTLMAVDDGQRKEIELCETSAEMIELAANFGISHDRSRMYDHKELSKDFEKLWGKIESVSDVDVRGAVGTQVLIISGLDGVLKDKEDEEELAAMELEEKEKADMVLNGDGEMPLHEDLGKIQADMNAHNNIN